MSDVAVHHGMVDPYEPSLFGTYSKKIGMWLFLLSDSLTFGALLSPTPTVESLPRTGRPRSIRRAL